MATGDDVQNALIAVISDELTDDSENYLFDNLVNQNNYDNDLVMNCSMNYLQDTERNPEACIPSYVEEIVPMYTNTQFQEHFRMNRNTFEILCQWISPILPKERSITLEKKMLATLWLLGNQESFRSVADRFGINKGTLHKIVINVCNILTLLQKDVIVWPASRLSLAQISLSFSQRYNFPGIVGLIDGTYINIPGPFDNKDAYVNRKGHTSMHLQVICDHNLKFIDVFTGWPGSVHDSRVYNNSDIKPVVENMPAEYHILGVSAYGLSNSLMIPFRDNGHLNDIDKKYNTIHSKIRVDVERVIGLLKGKFRRLKMLDMAKVTEIPFVITASCVLHNMILNHRPVEEECIDLDDHDDTPNVICDGIENTTALALTKRLDIAHQLI